MITVELYAKDCVICLKSNLASVLCAQFRSRDLPANGGNRPYRIAGLARYITVAFMGICFLVAGVAQAGHTRKVLVIGSYHPTDEWTGLVVGGIESTLKQYKDRIELDVEYMDTRYFGDERHYENLYALYKHKASRKQYDVVITSDNNALLFVLRYRGELYPNVPVVFCGIERFHEPMLQGHDDVTGVLEERLFESTVEIALKLHPSVKQIVFLSDGTLMVSAELEEALARVIQRFSRRVEFVSSFLSEFSTEELVKKVEGLGDESVVVFTCSFDDPEGKLYALEDGAAMLRERCAATPMYTVGQRWLDLGLAVGGKLYSGFHQGQTAAEMAIRILDGESARNIPIIGDNTYVYMFNYIQMKRFGISFSDLPEGSIVVNEPKSFYYLYKRRIWTVFAIIVGLAAVVMVLSVNILRRRKAEEKLLDYQKQLRSLASQLSLTEERERHRIATELHDRISQSLVISKTNLELLRESTSSEGFAKTLDEVCNSLDETIQNTRLLTSDLSSPILYELGFEAAVAEWLAEQIQEKHGIASEFEDDGQPKPLDDDICALLFRMVRELLINIVKHAQAHKVKVSIRKVDSEVCVGVEDDGVGFNPSGIVSMPTEAGGFGLFSIRERLEQLGGHLEIKSKPGHGTRVTVMAPLKEGKINEEGQE